MIQNRYFTTLLIISGLTVFSILNASCSGKEKLNEIIETSNPAQKPTISTPAEVVFSGVSGKKTSASSLTIKNTGKTQVLISNLLISGGHATAFAVADGTAYPLTVAAGDSALINIIFKPSVVQIGALAAMLTVSFNSGDKTQINLFGLSAKGEQGNNEPTLDMIVKTLGYQINVGGTGLILSTEPGQIGDEILTPIFTKAISGPVTVKPVARYSPDDLLEFGFYTKNDGTIQLNKLGDIALGFEQSLNPAITPGSKLYFEPGEEVFGFYTGSTTYAKQNTYSEDALNTGPLKHSCRIYPVKNRTGQPVANTYLMAFEPASNGDYQDYVFLVSNIKPAR